jgi:hypothetical protein
MADGERPEDQGQRPAEVVRTVFERLGETLDVTAKTARLSLDIGALNARKGGIFQEMGRKVYELYGKGLVKNSALLALCADVAGIDSQIAEKRAQIAELRGQHGKEAVTEEEELGIEEEPAAGPTTSDDLSDEEEREVRPSTDKNL